MSLSNLGRRYERLLFFAAPLALACILTLFVVFADNNQVEQTSARCFETAATLLETKKDKANEVWSVYVNAKRSSSAKREYAFDLRKLLFDTRLGSTCSAIVMENFDQRSKEGVEALVDSFRAESKRLFATPVRYPGVELPEKATVNLLGTSASIELKLFVSMLQVVLAPLLLLWLGSLYNTRYRETLLIGRAALVTEVFPHLINVYPAVRYPELRRRSYFKPYLAHMFALMYALARISLLSLFVGPIVAAYIASVFLVNAGAYSTLLYILASAVGTFTFALLICELFPWHVAKTFPGPPLIRPRD